MSPPSLPPPAVLPLAESSSAPLDESARLLLEAERGRGERLLTWVRLSVVVLLGVVALLYAPEIGPDLRRVNLLVIVPMLPWATWQTLAFRARRQIPRWLQVVNPVVDVTAITVLLLGYGLVSRPELAVKTPLFLAYFAVLGARPIASSTRLSAMIAALATAEYAGVVIYFVVSGRLPLVASPIDALALPAISPLDQGARILLLFVAGSVATYATAWHERLLRRALGAQVQRDAEERVLATRLQEADKLAAVGTLAASVAHEVNTPLTTIAMLADLIRTEVKQGQVADDARSIGDEARRTARVVRDLLAVARPGAEARGPVSINLVCERAVSALSLITRERHVRVDLDLDSSVPEIVGEQNRLEQVAINLVLNAVQAIDAVEPRSSQRVVRVTTLCEAKSVHLAVEDSGPGIAPSALERLFERFYTTKPAGLGTGLGLWIVQQIVQEHGGTISAENRKEGGARFVVVLPTNRMPESTPS